MKDFKEHAPQEDRGDDNMNRQAFLALIAVLGACNMDHQLGWVSSDSGTDSSTSPTTTFPTDAGGGMQVNRDTSGVVLPDAVNASQTMPGGPVDADSIATGETVDATPDVTLGPIQSWTGYIENYEFPSGSDEVRFAFATDSSGTVYGNVVFGDGAPPAPATDPNVGYPDESSTGISFELEGFSYTMFAGSFTPTRLVFTIHLDELWAGWCALQTPIVGSDTCLPADQAPLPRPLPITGGFQQCSMVNPSLGKVVGTVDCSKIDLCLEYRVCTCSSTACAVSSGGNTVSFDLALSADGIANGTSGDGHYFHFTKDP